MVKIAFVGSLFASLLGVVPLADDPPTPPPAERVVIDIAIINGSACAPVAAVGMTQDNTAFTITYDGFSNPPNPPAGSRLNCQAALVLHVPSGYTYAIQQVDYAGFAALGQGAVGSHWTSFGFAGAPPSPVPWPRTTHLLNGPYIDEWQAVDTVDTGLLIFAPCGRLPTLAINNSLDVTPRRTPNFMTLEDSTYHLAWRRCPTP